MMMMVMVMMMVMNGGDDCDGESDDDDSSSFCTPVFRNCLGCARIAGSKPQPISWDAAPG